jgi:hypothetical protein
MTRTLPHRALATLFTAALAFALPACTCDRADWGNTSNGWDPQPQETPPWSAAGGASWTPDDGSAGAPGSAGATGSAGSTGSGGAAGAVGGSGGGAGSCDGGAPSTPVCQFDNQCGVGGRCRNGACERGCHAAGECGTGQTCAGGFCRTAPPTSTGACVYDADCGAAASCINGVCHARCGATAPCASPADACVAGVCQPDVGPRPQCRGAADCPAGRACVNAVCRASCGADADCCTGSSIGFCRAGVCVTPHEAAPQCHVASDCGAGVDCVDAICGG